MDVLTPRNNGAPASYNRCDPCKDVPAAGKAGELLEKGGVTSRRGLQDDIIVATPRTPDALTDTQRRHRQKGGPGEINLHWGLQSLKVPHPCEGYGMKSNKGEDVAQNFKSGQKLGVAEYFNERAEAVYKSTKREPLGQSYVRGHVLPSKVLSSDFLGFGNATERSETGSKDAIFPRGVTPDTEEIKALYKKTHGASEPGEGVSRSYNWPKAVKDNPLFRFGAVEPNSELRGNGNGAKSALTMDCGEGPLDAPKTVILKDSLVNFQKVSHDRLATSRRLMQGHATQRLPEGHTHGKASASDPITAGAIVRGFYSVDEQMPDHDLGKCITVGRRNFETQEPLGVPSVRYDIPAPPIARRSVACSTNYGDDIDASGLIAPSRFQFQGVTPEDFQARRSLEELESLLRGAGFGVDDETLKAILADACDGDEKVSLEAVMSAIYHWKMSQP